MMKKNRIVLAGGSGFLGRSLSDYFTQLGYEIVVLSRSHHLDTDNLRYCKWDGKSIGPWTDQLEGALALINLNGKSVDCRYNELNKQLIYDSRINATYILGEAMKQAKSPPEVWINSSSATIYRHTLDKEMDEEQGEIGTGFSVDVCKKWEGCFNEIDCPGTRKVIFRTGIVLDKNDGALKPLTALAKLGFGGKQGDGKQFMSWIHVSDFCDAVNYAIQNASVSGIYNVSAPNPVPNRNVMREIRKRVGMPIGFPMPRWLLSLGARIIKTETELILKSRKVIPGRLLASGFSFQYNTIDAALSNLLNR